ncbi:MAG: hypothetical protein ACJ71Q_21785 [Terriglobales bacterium]
MRKFQRIAPRFSTGFQSERAQDFTDGAWLHISFSLVAQGFSREIGHFADHYGVSFFGTEQQQRVDNCGFFGMGAISPKLLVANFKQMNNFPLQLFVNHAFSETYSNLPGSRSEMLGRKA